MRPPFYPSTFEAHLPDRAAPLFFEEARVLADGNCGFTLLGVTRDEFANTLAPLADDPETRASIWDEIHEALTTELWEGPSAEWQTYFNTMQRLDGEFQTSLVELGVLYNLDHTQPLNDFILSLDRLGHIADAERLRQTDLDIDLQRTHFEIYCKRKDVFLAYIERLRINEAGNLLWIGNKSAVLYAKIKNISLYLWRLFEEGSNQLDLESSHVSAVPNGQVIHGLRTDDGTHYNLLVEQENVEAGDEYDFEAEEEYDFGDDLGPLPAPQAKSSAKAHDKVLAEIDVDDEPFLKAQIESSFSKYASKVEDLDFKPTEVFYVKTSAKDYSFFDLGPKNLSGLRAVKRAMYDSSPNLKTKRQLEKAQKKIVDFLRKKGLLGPKLTIQQYLNEHSSEKPIEKIYLTADEVAQLELPRDLRLREPQQVDGPTIEKRSLKPVSVMNHHFIPEPQWSTPQFNSATETNVARNVGATEVTFSTLSKVSGLGSHLSAATGAESSRGNSSSSLPTRDPSLVSVYSSGGREEDERWDVTELVRYQLRRQAAQYRDLLAGIDIHALDGEEVSSSPLIPNFDFNEEPAFEEAGTPLVGSSAVPPSSPPPSPPPSEVGAAVPSEEASDLKAAFIGSPVLLEVLLRIINKFNMDSPIHRRIVTQYLETTENKQIIIGSPGKEHYFSIENGELKHAEKTMTEKELAKIDEAVERERWESFSEVQKEQLKDLLSEKYSKIYGKFDPSSVEHRKIVTGYMRYCREQKELIDYPEGAEPKEIKFTLEDGELHYTERTIDLVERNVRLMEHYGPEGDEPFLRAFDPESTEHRRYARAAMEAEGLDELVVAGKDSKFWTLRKEGENISCRAEECKVPKASTKFSKPSRWNFIYTQAYHKHCLEQFELKSSNPTFGKMSEASFEKQCLEKFEADYVAPKNPDKFPHLKKEPAAPKTKAGSEKPTGADSRKVGAGKWSKAKMSRFAHFTLKQFELKAKDSKLAAMDKDAFFEHCLEKFEAKKTAAKNRSKKVESSKPIDTDSIKVEIGKWNEAKVSRFSYFTLEQYNLRYGDPKLAAMDESAFLDYCFKKFEVEERATTNRSRFLEFKGGPSEPDEALKRKMHELFTQTQTPEALRKNQFHQERAKLVPGIMEKLGYEGPWQTLEPSKSSRFRKALNEELITKGYGDLLEIEAREAKFQAAWEKTESKLREEYKAKKGSAADLAELNSKIKESMREQGYGDLVGSKPPKDPKPPTSKACADGLEETVIRGKVSRPLTLQDVLNKAAERVVKDSERGVLKRLRNVFFKRGFHDLNTPVADFLEEVSLKDLRKIPNCGSKTIKLFDDILQSEGMESLEGIQAEKTASAVRSKNHADALEAEQLARERASRAPVTRASTLQDLLNRYPDEALSKRRFRAILGEYGLGLDARTTTIGDFLEQVSYSKLQRMSGCGPEAIKDIDALFRAQGIETGLDKVAAEYTAPPVKAPFTPEAFNPELPSHRRAAYEKLHSLHRAYAESGRRGKLPSLRVTDIKGLTLEIQMRGTGITYKNVPDEPTTSKACDMSRDEAIRAPIAPPSDVFSGFPAPAYVSKTTVRFNDFIRDGSKLLEPGSHLPVAPVSGKPSAVFQAPTVAKANRVVFKMSDPVVTGPEGDLTLANKKGPSARAPKGMSCAMAPDNTNVIRGTVDYGLALEPSGTASAVPKSAAPARWETVLNRAARNPVLHFAGVGATIVGGVFGADASGDLLKKAGLPEKQADLLGAVFGTGLAYKVGKCFKSGGFSARVVGAIVVDHLFNEKYPHMSTPGSRVDTAWQTLGHTASVAANYYGAYGEALVGVVKQFGLVFASEETQVAAGIATGKAIVGHLGEMANHAGELSKHFNYSGGDSGLGHHYRFEPSAPAASSAPLPTTTAPAMTPAQAREGLASLATAAASSSSAATARSVVAGLGGLPVAFNFMNGAADLGRILAANVAVSPSVPAAHPIPTAVAPAPEVPARAAAPAPIPAAPPAAGSGQTPEQMRAGLKQLAAAVTASPAGGIAAAIVAQTTRAVAGALLGVPSGQAQAAKPTPAVPPAAAPTPAVATRQAAAAAPTPAPRATVPEHAPRAAHPIPAAAPKATPAAATPAPRPAPAAAPIPTPAAKPAPAPAPRSAYVEPVQNTINHLLFPSLLGVSNLQNSLFDSGPSFLRPASSSIFGSLSSSSSLVGSYSPFAGRGDSFGSNLWDLWSYSSPFSSSLSLGASSSLLSSGSSLLGGLGSVSGARTGLSWDRLTSLAAAEMPRSLGVLPSYLFFANGPDQIFKLTVENELRDHGMEFMNPHELYRKVQDHLYSMKQGYGIMMSYGDFCAKVRSSGLVESYIMFNRHSGFRISRSWGEIGGVAATVGLIKDLPDSATHDASRYVICFPSDDGKAPFTEAQLKQIARENADAFFKHKTTPFFSLDFAAKSHLVPIIHPAFQNTLTGKVISVLDYILKGLLNGGTYDQAFIENWFKGMNFDDGYLRAHLIDLKKYCKEHVPGFSYLSLREMMKRAGIDEDSLKASGSGYSQPFKTSFRIISKIDRIERNGNAFIVYPDFDVEYSIELMPDYEAYINRYLQEHGQYPEEYEKTQRCYEGFKVRLKEYLKKLPICRDLMKMLGVINFYSYFYNTLQTMGKMPDLDEQPEEEHYATPAAFPPLPVRSYKVYPLEITIGDIVEKLHAMEAATPTLEKIDDLLKPMFASDEVEGLPDVVVDRVKAAVTDIIVDRLQASVPGLTPDTVNTDDVDKLAERFFGNLLIGIQGSKRAAEMLLNQLLTRAKTILGEPVGSERLSHYHETIESVKNAMKKRWVESPECLELDLAQLLPRNRITVNKKVFGATKLLPGCIASIRLYFENEKYMLALPGYIASDKQNQKDYANLGEYAPSDHEAVKAELAKINERLPKAEAQLASYNKAEERREFKEKCGDDELAEALFAAVDSQNEAAFEAKIEPAARANAIQLFVHFLTQYENVLSQINRFTHRYVENEHIANRVLDDEKQYCHSTIGFNSSECKDGVRLEVKGGCGVRIPNIRSKPIHNPDVFAKNLSKANTAAAESWTTMEHAGKTYAVTNMKVKDHVSITTADYLGGLSAPTKVGDATPEQIKRINAVITQYALKTKEKDKLEAAELKLAVDPSGSRAIHHAAVILAPSPFIDFCRLDFTQLGQRDSFGHLPLHSAATVGNVGVVTAILTIYKEQLNAVTLSGDTALIAAVRNGRKAVVDLLLQKGADANHQPPSELFALYIAIQSNFPDIALLLLEKVPTLNLGLALANKMTALHLALELDMKVVATQLIERGAPLDGRRKSDGYTPFHVGVAQGDQALITLMLAKGAKINEALDSGKTALHIAAAKGHLLVVRQLLAAGANPAAETVDGDNPLMVAIRNGHKAVALELAAVSPINAVNKAKQTASLLAVENNLWLVADSLWVRGEDPELKDKRDLNSIYYLLRQGDAVRFEKLLSENKIKNINQQIAGESLYAIAARHGHFAISISLGSKAATFASTLTDKSIVFQIIMAVQNDEVGFLRFWQTLELSKRGFETLIPVGEYQGKTLAYLAAERGSLRCLKVLRASLTDEEIVKQEILIAAIRSRSLEAVELCAIRDFQQALNTEGNNALHLAVFFGSREIMEYLLRCGFKTTGRNKNKQTAFHIALLNNDAYLLKRLMKETPKDEWPRDLHDAINSQTSKSILKLLEAKGYPDSESKAAISLDKERELEIKRQNAALRIPNYQRLKIQIDRLLKIQNIYGIAALVDRYPSIIEAYRSEAGKTLVLELLNRSFKPIEKTKAPAAAGAGAEASDSSTDESESEEEDEDDSSKIDIKKMYHSFKVRGLNLKLYVGKHNPLLDLIDTDVSDEQACYRYSLLAEVFPEAMVTLVTDVIDGHSILKRALHSHKVKLFERMLQSRGIARSGEWDAEIIPLHEAILANRYDLAISLLSDSTVNKPNRAQRTPLMLAALGGNLRLMQALLSHGANPDALDNEGDSALQYALLAKQEAAALFLLPVVHHKDKGNRLGVSPLARAAGKGLLNVVRAITQEGDYREDMNVLGQNALHMAASEGKEEVIEYLVSQGFNVNQIEKPVRPSKIKRGVQRSPLQLAALNGQVQAVIKLIELGADMTQEDEIGRTFFEYVLLGKNRELWKLVRNLVKTKYPKHVSHLVLAAAQANQSDALLELLTEGVDANAIGRLGNSALHLAASSNAAAAAKLLLSRITAVDYRNNLGETALHSAAQRGHVTLISLLNAAGAHLNLLNNERLSALYLACKEGRAGAVVALTRYGADFSLRDPLGISPAQIAFMQGHFSIAAHLAKQGDNSLMDDEVAKLPEITQAKLKAHKSWLVQCQGLYLASCRLSRLEKTTSRVPPASCAKTPGTLFNHRTTVPVAAEVGAGVGAGAGAGATPVMRSAS